MSHELNQLVCIKSYIESKEPINIQCWSERCLLTFSMFKTYSVLSDVVPVISEFGIRKLPFLAEAIAIMVLIKTRMAKKLTKRSL